MSSVLYVLTIYNCYGPKRAFIFLGRSCAVSSHSVSQYLLVYILRTALMQLTAAPATQATYLTYSQKKQTNPTIISWQSVPPLFQRRCFEWKADVEKCPSLFVLNLWFKGLMLDRLYAVKRPLDYRKRSLDGKVLKSIQKLLTTRCFLLRDTEQFSLVGLLLSCLAFPSGFFYYYS